MHGLRLKTGLLLAIAVSTLGCTSSPWSKKETVSTTPPPQTSPAPATTDPAVPPGASIPVPGPVPTDPLAAAGASSPPGGQTIESILAEVRQAQPLDAKTEEELVNNLRATPPSLWPMVVQQFHAALAYRRLAQQRDRQTRLAGIATAEGSPQPLEDQVAAYHRRPETHDETSPPSPPPAREPAAVASRDERRASPSVVPLPDPREAQTASRKESSSPAPPPATTAHPTAAPPEEATAESAPDRPVVAPYQPRVAGDWRTALGETIRLLESKVDATPQSPEEIAEHTRLRMLYLANGRRDEALRPIPSLSTSMQDFWSKQFYGLSVMLDSERNSEPSRQAGEAQRHLSDAVVRLRETAPLLVRNLSFVTDVQSYGSFKPFDKYDFRAGQRVLLYAEVENFKIKESNRGYHTAMQSSYRILDARGQRIAEHDFGTNEEHCQNPRRDFFIGYEFAMPKDIPAGRYTLQLTVTDLNGDKIGQSSVDFTIVGNQELARTK
jgi:hypothetical protein